MSFNQVENHFESFLRSIDCKVVLNICLLHSIVQIRHLYLERRGRGEVFNATSTEKKKKKVLHLAHIWYRNNVGLYVGELVAF